MTLQPKSGDEPDPRLVELVRLLARRAALQWFVRQREARRQAKEVDSPQS